VRPRGQVTKLVVLKLDPHGVSLDAVEHRLRAHRAGLAPKSTTIPAETVSAIVATDRALRART